MPIDYSTLFGEVYVPIYTQEAQDLLRAVDITPSFVSFQQEERQKVKGLGELTKDFVDGENPRPLTEEEAARVDQHVQQMTATAYRVQDKIKAVRDELDATCSDFTFKFKKRPRLKKAMKVIFGKNTSEITYKEYTAALELKSRLEMSDAASLFTKDDE